MFSVPPGPVVDVTLPELSPVRLVMEELNDKLVETEAVVEDPVDKFITGFIISSKSKETTPNDSVLLNIPSLSTSKSILSATPSESKSVAQTDTVTSLDSNC